MKFTYNDGGREKTGYKGNARDCVTRSIAIVTGIPYQQVYDVLNRIGVSLEQHIPLKDVSHGRGTYSRNGVPRKVYDKYLKSLGYIWTPTMRIGSGCQVHLREDELPKGRLIVRCSRHLTAVIDGVIHDTFDPSRDGTRCVYGYWIKD